jgi:flavin-binding protein dodecin
MEKKMPDVVFPTVNLNGTSKESLENGYWTALSHVQETIHKLRLCTPHGRDYQTVPETEYRKAQKQHENWMKMLDKIENDLTAITEHLVSS